MQQLQIPNIRERKRYSPLILYSPGISRLEAEWQNISRG
jgi:hypothetical protein